MWSSILRTLQDLKPWSTVVYLDLFSECPYQGQQIHLIEEAPTAIKHWQHRLRWTTSTDSPDFRVTSNPDWWHLMTWSNLDLVKVWRAEEIGVPIPSQSPSNRRLQRTSAHMVPTLWGFQQSAKDRVLITCYFDIFRRVSFLELYLQILHDLTALMFVALHPGDRAAVLSIRGAPFAWTHYRTLFHNRFDHASIDIHATWAESTSMCVQIIPANWHTYIYNYIYTHIVTFFTIAGDWKPITSVESSQVIGAAGHPGVALTQGAQFGFGVWNLRRKTKSTVKTAMKLISTM